MAGNGRFDSSSASPKELGFTGSCLNGQRGNYTSATLDRSESFREGRDSRVFNYGASMPRARSVSVGDLVPLNQFLLLDPITMGDQKYSRLGELRRILGTSVGSATDDNSFGAASAKPLSPAVTEELKRFKGSVEDSILKARNRMKRFNESLLKISKYSDEMLKRQQKNEMLRNERSGGLNTSKMGTQIHHNNLDLGCQRLEDRVKNISLNKRVRSSVAELRADGSNSILPRQPMVMGKDRDMLQDGNECSELNEEKVNRLPVGGEGWDRKMKRKRSMGTVLARPADVDGDVKRVMHHKIVNESILKPYDGQGFSSNNKLDVTSLPASSNGRAFPKYESEKVSLTRDFAAGMNKERLLVKATNKLSGLLEDNHLVTPSPVAKGKASRAPRTSSLGAGNSSPNFPCASGAPDGWEQLPSFNKVNSVVGPNNRKRPMCTGSSSPPMAQWVGQRPQKISRTRRANVVFPVSNHDELQTSSEGGHISDFAAGVNSVGINGSLPSNDMGSGSQQLRLKHENVSSPARLSESEESGAGENHEGRAKGNGTSSGLEERSLSQNVSPVLFSKKKKMLNKEDTGDGIRRQGRTGHTGSSSRASFLPLREKTENPRSTKPIRSTKPVSDKSGSKSGRPPLKKVSDRKAFTRLGQTPTGNSPDFTGELDDHEELLTAANLACNASYHFCSNTFWKKMEPSFASISLEDSFYLKEELKSTEEVHESLSKMFSHGNDNSRSLVDQDDFPPLRDEESKRGFQDPVWQQKSARTGDLADDQDNGALCGISGRRNKVTPLYQRVLSALILEDELDEFEENSEERNNIFQYRDRSGFQTQKQTFVGGFSCNGSSIINGITGLTDQLCNDNLFLGDNEFMQSKTGMTPQNSKVNDGKQAGMSAPDCPYEQTCLEDNLLMELQSIGVYLETVPNLVDGDDEPINQDIVELQKGLHQKIGKKKELLGKIIKAVEEGREREGRTLEQVAMDRLVELAHKKQLATRGSIASKLGMPKVSKQVAQAFMKRTLARCRKFEETGNSCFSEPTLRDVIFAVPSHENNAEFMSCNSLEVSKYMQLGTPNSQQDARASGSFCSRSDHLYCDNSMSACDAFGTLMDSCEQDFVETGPITNRGKRKELLLDDVGSNASFRVASSLGNSLSGATKGKRSERERDKDALAKNPVTKGSRASQSIAKGDRKTKPKSKQKIAQQSASGERTIDKFKETTSNDKREVGLASQRHNPQNSSKERKETTETDLQELDGLGFGDDFGDLQGILEDLPENDCDLNGLAIPMDDLSMVL